MKELASVRAVDHHGGLGLWALCFFLCSAVLSFMEDIRLRVLGLPRGGVRHAQWFFAGFFQRLHAKLHEGFDLGAIALAVRANGLLLCDRLRKEKRIGACALRAACAASCRWQQGFVLRIKGSIGEVQMDFALNPTREVPAR